MSTLDQLKLDAQAFRGKRVIVRTGFDVPMQHGQVTDETRIRETIPTLRTLLDGGCSVVLLTHQGRPNGKVVVEDSVKPLVPILEQLLKTSVHFASSCVGAETKALAHALQPGEILLCENLRFDAREEKNDAGFAQELADLGDVYVNEAFSVCHRAHASLEALAKLLPAKLGLLCETEVRQLTAVRDNPKDPSVLILGGVKMETKVPVIENFLRAGSTVCLGGAVANTFLAATGMNMEQSLYEPEQMDTARRLMKIAEEKDSQILLPVDYIKTDHAIRDIGPKTTELFISHIMSAATVIWNGPVGYTEDLACQAGSIAIADALRASDATRIVGGGDTIEFHERCRLPIDSYSFVSTGGGAMLTLLGKQPLPALVALGLPL